MSVHHVVLDVEHFDIIFSSFLSDLASIAKETKCVSLKPDIKSEDVAVQVVKWLKSQANCLLVFDNLDDVTVIRGLLPEVSVVKFLYFGGSPI